VCDVETAAAAAAAEKMSARQKTGRITDRSEPASVTSPWLGAK